MRFDVATPEGSCEFNRHGYTHIPAMMFIDAKRNLVETTDSLVEKEELQKKFDDLLKR